MKTQIWEIRFRDGRGARFFTDVDVTPDVGRAGVVRTIPVAADVSEERALGDARRAIAAGNVALITFPMSALAFLLEHE